MSKKMSNAVRNLNCIFYGCASILIVIATTTVSCYVLPVLNDFDQIRNGKQAIAPQAAVPTPSLSPKEKNDAVAAERENRLRIYLEGKPLTPEENRKIFNRLMNGAPCIDMSRNAIVICEEAFRADFGQ
jgi:hypothetical protein